MDDRLPSLHRLVRICDNVYTADDILDMEEKILNSFKWRLPHTTVVRHLYLQFHLIGSEDLVVRNPAVDKATNDIVSLQLLIENKDEHVWKPFSSRAGCTIKDLIPQLCATVGMAVTASVEVFQVFGANPLVLQRIPQDTSLGSLSMDCLNLTRLFLSNGRVNYAFIERGPFIMPRTINKRFLNQCEVLIQEVVIHVEFLQVHSYVRALGALLLAMCIMATDMAEVVRAIRYVQNKLDISPGKSAAVARMLTTKYREVLKEAQQQHNLPDIPENIIARVDMCAAKKTT
ncbi:hypothetical protein TRVL_04693 [Trypanosoma vivax]|nr:hypothetical protein TRVL_04693 [Trypanosoma vivax]